MATPYRSARARPESTPLRLSWWGFAMSVLAAGVTGTLAYVLFRYVAGGWVGYGVAGFVALAAVLFAREIGRDKLGNCPRCDAPIEIGIVPDGYQCPSCKTFLASDRGALIVAPKGRVAKYCRFGVHYDGELVLPDCCCVCTRPATRRIPIVLGTAKLDVPYCAEHEGGTVVDPKRHSVRFRSLDYATLVCEANHGQLEGVNKVDKRSRDGRWLGFGLGILMSGGAALAYWGLAALERDGYEIVPGNLKGLVLWLCLRLLGRLWITAILATLAIGFFSMFIASFKPRLDTRPKHPAQ
ncbi:MAG TPA: hypothetical protein VIV40_36030 [Kofleriaceae bacterium]